MPADATSLTELNTTLRKTDAPMKVVVLVKLATAGAVCHGVASRCRTVGAQQQECKEGLSLKGSALARETAGVKSRG